MKTIKIILLSAFFILNANFEVFATTNAKPITYQGKLLDANNLPVTDDVTMTFSIYNAQSGGTKIWPTTGEVEKLVSVSKGLYSIKLGTGEGDDISLSASILSGTSAYLQVSIGGNVLSRTAINHVPYSIVSEQISAEGWASPGAIGTNNPNTAKFTTTETGTLKVTTGAGDGKILTSDANGNATWVTPATGSEIDLQNDVTGILPIENGGTGASSLLDAKINLGILDLQFILESSISDLDRDILYVNNNVNMLNYEINDLNTRVDDLQFDINQLGDMSQQNASQVNITGGTINGQYGPIQIDNVNIGSYYGYSNNTGSFSQLNAQNLDVHTLKLNGYYYNYGYNQPLVIGMMGEVRPSDYKFAFAPQIATQDNIYINSNDEMTFDYLTQYNNYYGGVNTTNNIDFNFNYGYYNNYYEITFTAQVDIPNNKQVVFLIVKNNNEIIGTATSPTWSTDVNNDINNLNLTISRTCSVTIQNSFDSNDSIKVVCITDNGSTEVKNASLIFKLSENY